VAALSVTHVTPRAVAVADALLGSTRKTMSLGRAIAKNINSASSAKSVLDAVNAGEVNQWN
jgi:hypothetical protein